MHACMALDSWGSRNLISRACAVDLHARPSRPMRGAPVPAGAVSMATCGAAGCASHCDTGEKSHCDASGPARAANATCVRNKRQQDSLDPQPTCGGTSYTSLPCCPHACTTT